MRHSCSCLIAFLLTLFSCPQACGEFVFDDFDDSAKTVSPDMVNVWVETEYVGPFDATRTIRIAGSQADPIGYMDANISNASTLTGIIDHLNPPPNGEPIVDLQVYYDFALSDFTQGGINNAIFLDFNSLQSEMPPSRIRIGIRDIVIGKSYEENIIIVPLSNDSFTIAIPFNAITIRGVGLGSPNFQLIRKLSFSIKPSYIWGGGPDPLNFHMELDAIRIGALPIPEPSAAVLVIACIGLILIFSCRHILVPLVFHRGLNNGVQKRCGGLGMYRGNTVVESMLVN